MEKKFKEKYNDGCIKIFKLINLLYEDRALYDDVIAIFSGDEDSKEKQNVTLNKFLNALKVFGMKIEKVNKKYEAKTMPFSQKFNMNDVKALNIFANFLKNLPDSSSVKNLKSFVNLILSRFDENTQLAFNKWSSVDNDNADFSYSSTLDQIKKCEYLCDKKFKVYTKYLKQGQELKTFCNAEEVIYDSKKAYLRIYKIMENEIEEVPISNIVDITPSPSQKTSAGIPMTVVYKLTNRLAKSYTLKESEYISEQGDDYIIVVNKNEPIDALLRRLMRYGCDCQIIRPIVFKRKMIETINDAMKRYA